MRSKSSKAAGSRNGHLLTLQVIVGFDRGSSLIRQLLLSPIARLGVVCKQCQSQISALQSEQRNERGRSI
jgi:hypothetical protein